MPYPCAAVRGKGGPCAAAPFTPASIAGLQLWLKADARTFQNTALTTPAVADGDPVGGWQDQSGNGNHVTQGTGTKKPTLKLAIQNGLPVIRFDGVSNFLARSVGSAIVSGSTLCVSWVAVQRAPQTNGRHQCLMNSASSLDYGQPLSCIAFETSSTALGLYRGAPVAATAAIAAATPYQITMMFDGVNGWLRLNGAAMTAAASSGTFGVDQVYLGCGNLNGVAAFSQLDYGEIVVCNAVPSPSVLASLEGYLKARWSTP